MPAHGQPAVTVDAEQPLLLGRRVNAQVEVARDDQLGDLLNLVDVISRLRHPAVDAA